MAIKFIEILIIAQTPTEQVCFLYQVKVVKLILNLIGCNMQVLIYIFIARCHAVLLMFACAYFGHTVSNATETEQNGN